MAVEHGEVGDNDRHWQSNNKNLPQSVLINITITITITGTGRAITRTYHNHCYNCD